MAIAARPWVPSAGLVQIRHQQVVFRVLQRRENKPAQCCSALRPIADAQQIAVLAEKSHAAGADLYERELQPCHPLLLVEAAQLAWVIGAERGQPPHHSVRALFAPAHLRGAPVGQHGAVG